MKHRAGAKFWGFYRQLPSEARQLADENFELLKTDSRHPSLHFKRIGIHYRALAIAKGDDVVWFWIGHHSEYDQLI